MTQIFAMIKKSSRYYAQRYYHMDEEKKKCIPFEIEFKEDDSEYAFGGVGGNYAIKDLNFYVKAGGKFVRLK